MAAVKTASPTQENLEQIGRYPADKLLDKGSHHLTQAELLAILIDSGISGKSAIDVANALLDQHAGLYNIYRKGLSVDDFSGLEGLGPAQAARILAALKIARLIYARQRFERAKRVDLPLFYRAEIERLHNEVDRWSEIGLPASVIGADNAAPPSLKIAEEVILRFSSIERIFGQDLGSLQEIQGLDAAKVIRIAATLEIASRLIRAFQT